MAIDDRDYMRDRQRKRDNYTEKSWFRRSQGGGQDHRYDPKQFRSGRDGGDPYTRHPATNPWGPAIVRTLVICFAVYGALVAIRDTHNWAQRKQMQRNTVQQADRKEAAWAAYYQAPQHCAYAADQAWQQCLQHRSQARRQFEVLYARGQL